MQQQTTSTAEDFGKLLAVWVIVAITRNKEEMNTLIEKAKAEYREQAYLTSPSNEPIDMLNELNEKQGLQAALASFLKQDSFTQSSVASWSFTSLGHFIISTIASTCVNQRNNLWEDLKYEKTLDPILVKTNQAVLFFQDPTKVTAQAKDIAAAMANRLEYK